MSVICIHGTGGSPQENWFPWLSKQLEDINVPLHVPSMPTPEGQNLEAWKAAFFEQIPAHSINEQSILIGHSMGAGFILRLLEDERMHAVQASFFVAGFIGTLGLPDYDALNITFVQPAFNWNAIHSKMGQAYVFASDADPYVPFTQTEALSQKLNVTPSIIKGGGHLNAEAGYAQFPELLGALKPLLKV